MTESDSDLAVLTRQARASLAAAGTSDAPDVELLVDGLGGSDSPPRPVLLLECDGQPRFVCDRDSNVARAAALSRPALLTIRPGPVCFAGRLARLADADGAAMVGLELTAVFVEAGAGEPAARIPVAAYRAGRAVTARS